MRTGRMMGVIGCLAWLAACGPEPIPNNSSGNSSANNTASNNATGNNLATNNATPNTSTNNTAAAMDTDNDGASDAEEELIGSNPFVADTDGDGVLDGSEILVGSDPTAQDRACGYKKQTASPVTKPVDVVFVVDNSASMQEEIESVQRNINENFADIIAASGLDYRVIMISQYGKSEQKNICVSAPLTNTDCDPPPFRPELTERFFHFDTRIGSNDALQVFLDSYTSADRNDLAPDGWNVWLREGSEKAIIVITDDQPEEEQGIHTASDFDNLILQLDPPRFGVPGSRNYVFHAIIGIAPKANSLEAWQPNEEIQMELCGTGVEPALEYQKLSILTEGVRFPVCEVQSYDAVFREAAQDIIDRSRIKCSFLFPPAPEEQDIDPEAVALELRVGGQTRRLERAETLATCATDRFYVINGRVELCPSVCDEVTGLTEGSLTFVSGCMPETCENPEPEVCDDGIDNDCNGFADDEDPACIG